jgi:hypothetical protein
MIVTGGAICQICYQLPCRCGEAKSTDHFQLGAPTWVPFVYAPTQRELIATAIMAAMSTTTSNGWLATTDMPELADRAVNAADALIAALTAVNPEAK